MNHEKEIVLELRKINLTLTALLDRLTTLKALMKKLMMFL